MRIKIKYKYASPYRTLSRKAPIGEGEKGDIVILSFDARLRDGAKMRSLEGVFLSNKYVFADHICDGKIISRDAMRDIERQYGGVFVPFS